MEQTLQEPIGLETRAPQTGVKLEDMIVLKQLVMAGADLTAPRHVLYYLSFDNQVSAEAAAQAATNAGFLATIEAPEQEEPGEWSVVCEREGYVLSMDIVRDNTDFFEELARRLGGEFDGWEASAD